MRALIRLSGATSESTNETMSLLAKRLISATRAIGDVATSVRPMTVAPWSRAKRTALTVRLE